ncbi:DUF4255 domain-containing protein [Kribbella sandramycini]|uniref:DUF4255 domain-containing protein n=1 Tax=Kribbella sandramycini TaxID=60450 RepID=A0A7Y4L8L0_9ACTN|nr:hypothetical protein [Kribbella sandramycini]NOL45372.1 DUF4255 domain-containing protein [Kribbella sandramycini]
MISEADAALAALLRRELLDASRVQVVFDPPTKEWAAKRNGPAVNLFLYDIREDTRRRSSGLVARFNTDGRVIARQTPPRIFRLFYLLSVWGQRAEDEHRLLGQLLDTLLTHDQIPPDLLPEAPSPVGLSIGLPPEDDRSFADVWSALGGELRPSLDVVLSLPIEAGHPTPAGALTTTPLHVDLADRERTPESAPRGVSEPADPPGGSGSGKSPGDAGRRRGRKRSAGE